MEKVIFDVIKTFLDQKDRMVSFYLAPKVRK